MASSALWSCSGGKTGKITYPDTFADTTVVDDYFGTQVADPYRWLENDTSEATADWVAQQNEVTTDYLEKIPFRSDLKERFSQLMDYEKIGIPFKKNGKYYSYRNSGLQNQSVLYVQDSLGADPRVVLDPNTLSDDGTVALKAINFSNDGKYLAYVISRSGSDWNEIYVLDLESGNLLPDHITWAKFTDAQWLGDGFFYSAYDAPVDGNELSASNEFQKVYYHKLGTPQSEDKLEYWNEKYPLRFYSVSVNDDESFMVLYESEGHGGKVYIKDLRKPGAQWKLINDRIKDEFNIIDNVGNTIYAITNIDAPKNKIVKFNLDNFSLGKWDTVIPEGESVISSVQLAGDNILVTYLQDASSHPYLFDLKGNLIKEVELPTLGTASFSTEKGSNEAFFTLTSFTVPTTVYSYDLANGDTKIYAQPELKFNPEDYVTEQLTFPSKDSTEIKMFVTHKKDIKLDGTNPTLIYGYGGFNISLTPGYSASRMPFIENGGVYAYVNLRGGGEYGEEWHQAGTKMNKQNVFDDFISAAEFLIEQGYTSPEHIAIQGGSNGGLLVGAVVNQRPDLYKVAIPQVGVMDMLRYHLFTIGWNWAADYGRSDDNKEMFEYLRAYSPLHTIKSDGTPYPAILVTTADHDDRVVPAHSFKYTATLQAADTGDAPKLIRIDSKAGHGSGKPVSKVIDEQADIYSFIMYNLGMNPKFSDK
ncbi:MAG: prolyl oligopeptidase family serine peptidase [Muribaculaceae bacterium]|nr:prolyl oligopeptidase family serine peptidase [Muribaculaceae bacterium]